MKKIVLLMSFMLLTSGFLIAQSSENYRSRNHKLSKYGKTSKVEDKKFIAVSRSVIDADFYNYLSRNSKFHKTESEKNLFIRKGKVDYDYRTRNYKLNKKFKS